MYELHALKQDPISGAVATRTIFDEDGPKAWLVFSLNQRFDYVYSSGVEDWTDMVPKTG